MTEEKRRCDRPPPLDVRRLSGWPDTSRVVGRGSLLRERVDEWDQECYGHVNENGCRRSGL